MEFPEMRWYHVSQRGPGLKRSGKMIPGLLYDFNIRLTWNRCFQRRAMAIGGKWECGGLVRTSCHSDWESNWRPGWARADERQHKTGWCLDVKSRLKTSLVVQRLGICLPMQGTWVWSLIQENPTCFGAPGRICHSYGTWALEPVLSRKRSYCNEKPVHPSEE